jgi:hypothetical protein
MASVKRKALESQLKRRVRARRDPSEEPEYQSDDSVPSIQHNSKPIQESGSEDRTDTDDSDEVTDVRLFYLHLLHVLISSLRHIKTTLPQNPRQRPNRNLQTRYLSEPLQKPRQACRGRERTRNQMMLKS